MPPGSIKLVLADHDPLPRRAVVQAMGGRPEVQIVAEASSYQAALTAVADHHPDVILMDTELPPAGGIVATAQLLAISPGLRVVLFAVHESDEVGLAGLEAGASGFLSKDIDMSALARALRSVSDGEAAISRRLTHKAIDRLRTLGGTRRGMRPVRGPLTDRQWEVLDLAAEGQPPGQIAAELGVSVDTVRAHLRSARHSLGARSLPEMLRAAEQLRTGVAG